MLSSSIPLLLLGAASSVDAFGWVARQPGVDSSLISDINPTLEKRQQNPTGPGSAAQCPFNPDHKGAAPFNPQYPYNNAKNGQQGNGKGGYRVPAEGDTAHYFVAPDYTKDIRGPCPGLNAMANHNFLSHDGIVTFTELVDAQQNVYNVGYDLANLLAVLGLTTTDGDPITNRLSIGCDATERTSTNPTLTGRQPGLDGHNKFEADTSLTRNDYFTGGGDNFSFNGTLFKMMTGRVKGLYNRENLALYRYHRYQQSRSENRNFYFGPFSLLLFGASSFLYELMPSGTRNYRPDIYTISSFFGATKKANGNWVFNGHEKLPDNWTNRVDPYDNNKVGSEIFKQYALYPVQFGGNTGKGQFNVISGNGIQNGKLNATDGRSVMCLIYQLSTERFPTSLNGFVTPSVEAVNFAVTKLLPAYNNLGCSRPLT